MTEPERPADYVELIIKGSWLNEFEYIITAYYSFGGEWGFKHPQHMPRFRFLRSPFQRWLKRMQSIAL